MAFNVQLSEVVLASNDELQRMEADNSLYEYEAEYESYRTQERNSIAPAIFASDLFARPEQPVTAFIPDFIYAGAITGVFAAPKVGKSTLLWYLLQGITQKEKVLQRDSVHGRVLYASEQNEASFRYQAKDVPGFTTNDNLAILLIEDNKITRLVEGKEKRLQISSWETQLQFWTDLIEATEASVFVIDTLGALFHLPMGGENDNGLMQQRMAQLRCLFDIKPNLAIVVIHHNRKDDKTDYRERDSVYGTLADSRGASAIGGAVDHSIIMTKKPGDSPIRYLKFEGRYRESNGMTMDIELLADNHYAVLQESRPSKEKGHYQSSEDKLRATQLAKLESVLHFEPDKAKSMAELEHLTGMVQRTLKPLLTRLAAQMDGSGKKGDPFVYWRHPFDAGFSA